MSDRISLIVLTIAFLLLMLSEDLADLILK